MNSVLSHLETEWHAVRYLKKRCPLGNSFGSSMSSFVCTCMEMWTIWEHWQLLPGFHPMLFVSLWRNCGVWGNFSLIKWIVMQWSHDYFCPVLPNNLQCNWDWPQNSKRLQTLSSYSHVQVHSKYSYWGVPGSSFRFGSAGPSFH